MTETCGACGREFTENPLRAVPCPTCGADPGSPCKRPSGWTCEIHVPRERLALAVTDYGPCPVNGGETGPEAARKLLSNGDVGDQTLGELGIERADLERVADGEWPIDVPEVNADA